MMLKVIDLAGSPIRVDDQEAAIKQADVLETSIAKIQCLRSWTKGCVDIGRIFIRNWLF
ncbi:hypothetical protein ACUN24_20420 [Pedobacter sp. WC2501]|uniref:hypothetical protein n=1 Tax=Pedobacter sp. WC2501 TaxID=3461400 RepID=UPI0040466322